MMNAKELELKLSDALQREDVLKQKLAVSQREFRAADATIENLQMKLEKLAAENAGLKAAAEFATAPDMWEELGGNVMRYQYQEWYADRLKSAMETPATGVFLAEVRAIAIETCADDMASENNIGGNEVDAMYVYAENLRKGVQS